MTDWQQPLVVALTQANGLSIVHETVYENRLLHLLLVEMGATHPVVPRVPGLAAVPFPAAQLDSAVIFRTDPLTGRDIDVPALGLWCAFHRGPRRRAGLQHHQYDSAKTGRANGNQALPGARRPRSLRRAAMRIRGAGLDMVAVWPRF